MRAQQLVDTAIRAGHDEGMHSYGTTFANWFLVLIDSLDRRAHDVRRGSEAGIPHALEGGFQMFVPMMAAAHGWAVASIDQPAAGRAEIDAMCRAMSEAGVRMLRHFWLALRAEVELIAGDHQAALVFADDGLLDVETFGEHWFEAELHRLRGLALAGLGAAPEATAAIRRAVEVASSQGAERLQARAKASLEELHA